MTCTRLDRLDPAELLKSEAERAVSFLAAGDGSIRVQIRNGREKTSTARNDKALET